MDQERRDVRERWVVGGAESGMAKSGETGGAMGEVWDEVKGGEEAGSGCGMVCGLGGRVGCEGGGLLSSGERATDWMAALRVVEREKDAERDAGSRI